jgi:alkanesulfonate monooxygenase SsuD/methylene tetrahydromethanopterin reductase-like flavin-dependent oxidoreductase (luciferase family)
MLAEKLGYYGFHYGEPLADIDLDCWTIISNLSAITNKIKLGPVITYLLPQYRNIFLLAKQAMTLQQISNGRLESEQVQKRLSNGHHNGGIHMA